MQNFKFRIFFVQGERDLFWFCTVCFCNISVRICYKLIFINFVCDDLLNIVQTCEIGIGRGRKFSTGDKHLGL